MVPASLFTTIAIDLHVCKRGESLALFSVVVSRFCFLILQFLFHTLFFCFYDKFVCIHDSTRSRE